MHDRIEHGVFILYTLDGKSASAFNLQKNPNCFELSTFKEIFTPGKTTIALDRATTTEVLSKIKITITKTAD